MPLPMPPAQMPQPMLGTTPTTAPQPPTASGHPDVTPADERIITILAEEVDRLSALLEKASFNPLSPEEKMALIRQLVQQELVPKGRRTDVFEAVAGGEDETNVPAHPAMPMPPQATPLPLMGQPGSHQLGQAVG